MTPFVSQLDTREGRTRERTIAVVDTTFGTESDGRSDLFGGRGGDPDICACGKEDGVGVSADFLIEIEELGRR